jgi:hypothetical protein
MNKLLEKFTRSDSEAKKQAKMLGLKYHGFGYWGTPERVTHKTVNGLLHALPTSKTFEAPPRYKYDNSAYNRYMGKIPSTTHAGFHKEKSALLRGQLTDEEHNEILEYLNSSSQLNGFLGEPAYRKTLLSFPDKIKKLMQKTDTIDGIMKKSKLEEDITLYRGIFGTSAREFIQKAIADGKEIISSPCYMSTSMSPGVAHGFEDYGNPIMLIIKAKKGQNALVITPDLLRIPSETSDEQRSFYNDVSEKEHEIILPRNTKLRVIRVEERTKPAKGKYVRETKVTRIVMEIV